MKVFYNKTDEKDVVSVAGRIDSSNAQEFEIQISELIEENSLQKFELNALELEYISSAGLRVILRLLKKNMLQRITDVSTDVYDILEMTGFTEMLEVDRGYRRISVDGCEVIGEGANGKVYRIDSDTIVKVYPDPDSLPEIRRERELARAAFVLGIPTAIPFDVVRVGSGYGSVFEMLNADSFAGIIRKEPDRMDEMIGRSVVLLKQIHSTIAPKGPIPSMKATSLRWCDFLKDHLPAADHEKLCRLISEIPEDQHLLHGDYHVKNIMLQDGEALLIDMDTICTGNPIFEFAFMFNTYQGFGELNPEELYPFLGISYEQGGYIWRETLRLYFDGLDDDARKEIEKKARIIGAARLLRRTVRRNGYDSEYGRARIERCRTHIHELLSETDSLAI